MQRLIIVLILGAAVLAAPAPVRLTITPTFSFPPANIRISIFIEPHGDNRQVCLTYDSDIGQSGHSCWQLDGESPRQTIRTLKGVSAGAYEVVVRVLRAGGEVVQARGQFQVGATGPE